MITLKEGTAKWEHFGQIHPQLGKVFYDFCKKLKSLGVNDIVITSIIRPKTKDSGVHECGRAIDIRADFQFGAGEKAMDYINSVYKYDKDRNWLRTAIFHKTKAAGDYGDHFHLQVRG